MPGSKRLLLIKVAIWIAALLPLVMLLIDAAGARLGPDPGKTVVDSLGLWALRLLLLTLALRPLREITGHPQFVQVRRLFGLFSWFYASLHLLAASFYIIGWSWSAVLVAIQERTYILLGFVAWLLLTALGVTSTRAAQRFLGKRWRQLHQLIYPAAILGSLHFLWLVRSDYREPGIYILIAAVLLAWRLRGRSWSQAKKAEVKRRRGPR